MGGNCAIARKEVCSRLGSHDGAFFGRRLWPQSRFWSSSPPIRRIGSGPPDSTPFGLGPVSAPQLVLVTIFWSIPPFGGCGLIFPTALVDRVRILYRVGPRHVPSTWQVHVRVAQPQPAHTTEGPSIFQGGGMQKFLDEVLGPGECSPTSASPVSAVSSLGAGCALRVAASQGWLIGGGIDSLGRQQRLAHVGGRRALAQVRGPGAPWRARGACGRWARARPPSECGWAARGAHACAARARAWADGGRCRRARRLGCAKCIRRG